MSISFKTISKHILTAALIVALSAGAAAAKSGAVAGEPEGPYYIFTDNGEQPTPVEGNKLRIDMHLYIANADGINGGSFGIEYNSNLYEPIHSGFEPANALISISHNLEMQQLVGDGEDGVGVFSFSWSKMSPFVTNVLMPISRISFIVDAADYDSMVPSDFRVLDFSRTVYYQDVASNPESYWGDIDGDGVPNYVVINPITMNRVEVTSIYVPFYTVSGTILTNRTHIDPAEYIGEKQLHISIIGKTTFSDRHNVDMTSAAAGMNGGGGVGAEMSFTESAGRGEFSLKLANGSYSMTIEKAGYTKQLFYFVVSDAGIQMPDIKLTAGNADYLYDFPTWDFSSMLWDIVGYDYNIYGAEGVDATDLADVKHPESGVRADINEDNLANHLLDVALVVSNYGVGLHAPLPLSASADAELNPGYYVKGVVTGEEGDYRLSVTVKTQGANLLAGRLGLAFDTDKLELLDSDGEPATNYTAWEDVVSATDLITLYDELNSAEAGDEAKMFSVTKGFVLLSWHANVDYAEFEANGNSLAPDGEIATLEFRLNSSPYNLDPDMLQILETPPDDVQYWDSTVMAVTKSPFNEHKNSSLELPTSQIVVLEGLPPVSPDEPDVPPVTQPQDVLYRRAFINGYTNGLFMPDSSISRAEIAAMITRIILGDMKTDMSYPAPFTDINPQAWYADYVGYVYRLGIMTGDGDGSFRPNDEITREEFAKVICETARHLGYIKEIEVGTPNFVDTEAVSDWAINYIFTAQKNGWINGYEKQRVGPKNDLSRAEAAKVIDEMQGRLLNAESIEGVSFISFPDIQSDTWYYYYIIAAANDYAYVKNKGFDQWIVAETMENTETVR